MAPVGAMKQLDFVLAIFALGACAPKAPPKTVLGPGSSKPEQETLDIREVTAKCGVDCVETLPAFATGRTGHSGRSVFLGIDETLCRIPGYNVSPDECTAICDVDAGLQTITVSYGALSPRLLTEVCRAVAKNRGEPDAATCETIPAGGLTWSATEQDPEIRFDGYLEYHCR